MQVHFYLADQNPHRDKTLGVTAYTIGILRSLAATVPDLQCRALVSRSSFRPDTGVSSQVLPWRTDGLLTRLLTDQFHPLLLKGERPNLWHYPKGHLPLFSRPPGPVVGTVHDTILQHYADRYPETRHRAEFTYWLAMLRRSVARFDVILTISELSRRKIEEFASRHGIRCPPIHVTWQGARGEERAGLPPTAKAEHVLHFASSLPHKRSATLLRHWQVLQERGVELPILQLVGAMAPEVQGLAESLRGVRLSSRLPESEVDTLLRTARAVIVPSEIEGFGLPLVEAYYAGTPVVFPAGFALQEMLPPGTPGAFELEEVDSFAAALEDVVRLDPARISATACHLRERLGWSVCAQRVLAGYRQALGGA